MNPFLFFGGLTAFVLLAAAIKFGWPVSGYCLVLFVASLVVEPRAKGHHEGVRLACRKALVEAINSALIGCGLVLLAELIFHVWGQFSTEQRVRAFELALGRLRIKLNVALHPLVALPSTVLFVILAFIRPRWRPLPKLRRVIRPLKMSLAALNTACLFTFFSAIAVGHGEPQWVAMRRNEVQAACERIDSDRRELVAAAVVQVRIAEMSENERRNLATLLATSGQFVGVVQGEAYTIGQAAPRIEWREDEAGPEDEAIDSARAWSAYGGESKPAPTLLQVEAIENASTRLDRALEESRPILADTLKKALDHLLPSGMDELIRPFVNALTEAIVRNAVDSVYPHHVSDLKTAMLWVKQAAAVSRGSGVSAAWNWVPATAGERRGSLPLTEEEGRQIAASVQANLDREAVRTLEEQRRPEVERAARSYERNRAEPLRREYKVRERARVIEIP